jgi:hypothetical protein
LNALLLHHQGFGVPPTPSTSKATRSEQSMLSTTSSNSKQPSTKVEASQSMPVASSSSTSSSSSGGSSDGSRNRRVVGTVRSFGLFQLQQLSLLMACSAFLFHLHCEFTRLLQDLKNIAKSAQQ